MKAGTQPYPPESIARLPTGSYELPFALSTFFQIWSLLQPASAGTRAARMFGTPRKRRETDIYELPEPWKKRNVRTEYGAEIVLFELGEGPAIGLLHGWNGFAAQFRPWTEAALRSGFRWLVWDMPGHGRSEGELSSVLEFARTLSHLSRTEGPFHGLVTHSLGGPAALLALEQYEVAIERVVLIASPAELAGFTEHFCRALRLSPAARRILIEQAETHFGVGFSDLTIDGMLSRIGEPPQAFIIHDDSDLSVPEEHGELILRSWPGSRELRTEGVGHAGLLRDTLVIADTIGFLSEG
jgi:pimeloyl-ACP methyl ester carboxylesterase